MLPNWKGGGSSSCTFGHDFFIYRNTLTFQFDACSRANAKAFLGVLPEKNYVATLVKGQPKNVVQREAVPYRRQQQPSMIQGGQMKEYQLTGLSWLAHMFENGQSCILADE